MRQYQSDSMFQIAPFHFSCLLSGIKDKGCMAPECKRLCVATKWHSYTADRGVIMLFVAFQRIHTRSFWGIKMQFLMVSKKIILYLCKCRIEKSSPSRSPFFTTRQLLEMPNGDILGISLTLMMYSYSPSRSPFVITRQAS